MFEGDVVGTPPDIFPTTRTTHATNTSFAEYLSCNGDRVDPTQKLNYTCICDNQIDRVIAHQTPEQIATYCNETGADENVCHCSAGSLNYSNHYTGIMPMSLPWSAHHG